MKKEGIVVPSKSPYNSPLLLVPKKDSSWRLVIDYRRLNSHTIPDRMPMPVISEVLTQLGGAKVFTSLDLLSGYHQVPLEEDSKPLTAFSTHNEHYHFNVMPFGLTSAPLTFIRLMQAVLGNMPNVMTYLDDIIIFSKSVEEHFSILEKVLERLQSAGLKIKVRKCNFMRTELDFLGHTISAEGIKMQQSKIQCKINYPRPEKLKALRRFLGMVSYYRPFIRNFSTIAEPLNHLLRKDISFVWTEKQQIAFEDLKSRLTTAPILTYPDFSKEFYLACDASNTGLGAVLLQKGTKRLMPLSFASRSLNSAERKYSTTEKECLALVWGLKKFRHLILGFKVHILTDHRPLIDLFKKRTFVNNVKFSRWYLTILEFSPSFKYIPGKFNTLADGLSRISEDEKEAYSFAVTCQVVDLDLDMVGREQAQDENINNIINDIKHDEKSRPDYQIINGLLYKRPNRDDHCARLYIPVNLRKEVIKLSHNYALSGHPGVKKTCQKITRNYFWPKCSMEAKEYVMNCEICNKHKGIVNRPAPLEQYPSELMPFQVVHMDIVSPSMISINGNKHILVFTDRLTRYTEIIALKDRTSKSVAEALKQRIIARHSCPQILISDNACEFTSNLLARLCEFYNIKKCQIVAHKPSSNGLAERHVRKLLDILKTLITPSTNNWDEYLEGVQIAINTNVNRSTGETPHFLLYGYEKRLPCTLMDNTLPPRQTYNYDDYVAYKTRKTYDIINQTRQMLQKAFDQSELQYNQRTKVPNIAIGQKVYVLKPAKEGPIYKVSPKFDGPYRVLELLKFNKIKIVDENNATRVVHTNNVKIVKQPNLSSNSELPEDDQEEPLHAPMHNYSLRSRANMNQVNNETNVQ